jgi:hypothetical protein
MIQRIRIGTLLRETAATPYRNLITRPAGAAVRIRIEAVLAESGCAVAFLDFSDVELLDFSCADEVVAKLLLVESSHRTIVLQGLREDQLEAIEQVLIHHELAAVAVSGTDERTEPEVIGAVTKDARDAFARIRRMGSASLGELAADLGWTESRGHDAVQALLGRHLIRSDGGAYLPLLLAG